MAFRNKITETGHFTQKFFIHFNAYLNITLLAWQHANNKLLHSIVNHISCVLFGYFGITL